MATWKWRCPFRRLHRGCLWSPKWQSYRKDVRAEAGTLAFKEGPRWRLKRNIREVGGKPRGGEYLKREEEKVTVTREVQSGTEH